MERESNNMFNDAKSMRFAPNWENSMDQNDPFESALSSMVSSPTASNANNINGENIVLRELIGRLGSISPFNGHGNGNNSSCYSTPLNSPPKLHLSSNNHDIEREERDRDRERGNNHFLSLPTLAPFSADPAFAERAARFSSFANTRVSGSHNGNGDSRENSTVSEPQIPNPRKRKSGAPKGKVKESIATENRAAASDELRGKRTKSQEVNAKEKEKEKEKQSKDDSEPQKDYIHVRARRGQATDAHSLAERVRREKISERMKVLQDLVPGCNKVTGKAVMLDEIINYVQSLQRQVEFLSMKLATVNPRMDINMEALLSKDMFQSLPHNIFPSETYLFQSHPNNALELPPMDNYGDAPSQVSSFWEDDLHSIVQMGFGTQNFQGIVPTSQMKVEL